MARKTRAQIADEELTQQLIEKGQARYEKAKRTKEMNADAKYRSMNREAQFNDQRMGFFERMQRAQEDANRNEIKTFEPKGQSANEIAEELEAKTADYNKKNQNIENKIQKVTNSGKMYTTTTKKYPSSHDMWEEEMENNVKNAKEQPRRVTHDGKYAGGDESITAWKKLKAQANAQGLVPRGRGKRAAVKAALDFGRRALNKYVDVDGVIEGIARNKAATAAGAAAVGTAAAAHHIKERQKEQQSDEDE